MKKFIVILAVAVIAVGGFFHYRYWQEQTDQLKAYIEALAAGKSDKFKLSYEAIATAGYPFKHEIVLKSPCFTFLGRDADADLSEGCLKGDMVISYRPHGSEQKLSLDTNGELTFKVAADGDGKVLQDVVVKGGLHQEFSFGPDYELAKSSDLAYFVENLLEAELAAKDMTIVTLGQDPKEYIRGLNGTLGYSRKPEGDQAQKIHIVLDYSAVFVDSFHAYEPPFGEIFQNLSADIREFNKKAGVNQGHYNITLISPPWEKIKKALDRLASYQFDGIPAFSIEANQNSKNNYFEGKGDLNVEWVEEDRGGFKLIVKNETVQDMSAEGEKEFSILLQEIAKEAVRSMINAGDKSGEQQSLDHFDDLFTGLPSHLEMELDLKVQKGSSAASTEKLSIVVDPFMISTNKGFISITVDYKDGEPFSAQVEIGSLERIVNALVSRYNIFAQVVGVEIPQMNKEEKESFLSILRKYSDNPEKPLKTTTWTINQSNDGTLMVGKQQDIRALVGELAFFFQHLQQKTKN